VQEYEKLMIRLDPDGAGGYEVDVEGQGGDGHNTFTLPFGDLDIENFVLRMSRGQRRRRMETPETERARKFGKDLFDALFQGKVRDVYRDSVAEAKRANKGLRLTLQLTRVPELMDVPWEYLYDEPNFLSTSTWTPIVRYLDIPHGHPALAVRPPLRILGMISSPADPEYEPLDVGQEKSRVEQSLRTLREEGRVEIHWLERPTLTALNDRLLLRPDFFHIFHYIGHGAYDPRAEDGVLLPRGQARACQPSHRGEAGNHPEGPSHAAPGGVERLRGSSQFSSRPLRRGGREPRPARDPGGHRDAVRDHRRRRDHLRRVLLRRSGARPTGGRGARPRAPRDLRGWQRRGVGYARALPAGG
jgi:hypothetical protein